MSRERTTAAFLVMLLAEGSLAICGGSQTTVRPKLALPAVWSDADDCAIWIHPTDPSKSTVIGNDKSGRKKGLYVYGLDATVVQFIPMDRPSNLDVRYGMSLGGGLTDICAAIERDMNQVRVFAIDPQTGKLSDVSARERISSGIGKDSYGLALYRRPADGAMFAFVSKRGTGQINQIRLTDDGHGRVKGSVVRTLGRSSAQRMVEGMVADDELGFLYAAEEDFAVLKFHADPDMGGEPISKFALRDGIWGDREGIAIYKCVDGTGYILLSSQGNSTVKVYAREGDNRFIKTVRTIGARSTDGLDVTPCPAGPRFPKGFLVCHNSPGKNFVLYAWENVAANDLKIRTDYDPRKAGAKAPRGR